MSKRHINEFYKSELANSGRAAGMGILEENYGDESFPGPRHCFQRPAFEHRAKGENGEVITYKLEPASTN